MTTSALSTAWKDFLLGVFAVPFLLFFSAAMSAWPLMLGLGVTHHAITAGCPALGFWATLALSWALSVLVGKLRPMTLKRGAK
jgi:uncharacterized membrane protein YjjB (DUF3815 family)